MKINKKLVGYSLAIILTAVLVSPNIMTKGNVGKQAVQTPANKSSLVSVIVGTRAGSTGVEEALTKLGAKITSNWSFINSFSADIPIDKVSDIASIPGIQFVNKVTPVVVTRKKSEALLPDAKLLVNNYNNAVKAEKLWASGYTGTGVTVAVVDSGIINGNDFTPRVIQDVVVSSSNFFPDKYGHGTHVAGIIAGNGKSSSGKYVGIAPGANLINVKVADDKGAASEKNLVDGLQWIYNNKTKYNIRVVNISSTVSVKQKYNESAVNAACEQLWKAGVVVVVSAGNLGGQVNSTSYAPSNDPFVITVGAVDDNGTKSVADDYIKSWSSSGTTLDNVMKPDIVAPGAHIISYMPAGALRNSAPQNIVDNAYFKMGGTSMAAPVVSGVVALMLQVNPTWTPDQVKWVLQNTARPYIAQLAGAPGIVAADNAAFYSNIPQSANQGVALSPLLDAGTGTISYNNMSWANMSWANMSWANSLDK